MPPAGFAHISSTCRSISLHGFAEPRAIPIRLASAATVDEFALNTAINLAETDRKKEETRI